LNKTYKEHRAIEHGFDQMIPTISKGENVFKKQPATQSKLQSTVGSALTTGYNEGSLFMTSLLKNSKVEA
jgi:hypothetical protein